MSSMKEKLARLKRGGNGATSSESSGIGLVQAETDLVEAEPEVHAEQGLEAKEECKGELEAELDVQMELDPRWSMLGVCEQRHAQGSFLIRESRYGLDYAHGDHCLGELVGLTELFSAMANGRERAASGLAGSPVPAKPLVEAETLLFFDTETTGLGVGAGNVAFMIGLGFYEKTTFVVQQLFIRDHAEERAMLAYVQELMATRHRLVSYNGKTFDWPLVKNRFIMNRLRLAGAEPEHYDLLYPSRSLWRNTLPSCRLSIVEKSRLGLSRIDDVPGSLAPELYFRFLAERNPTVLQGVFEHNEKDVLTLAALSVHLAKLLEGVIGLEHMDHEELYRMGAWMEKLGEEAKALEALDLLASRLMAEEQPSAQHALLCAAFYKRRQRYDVAVPLWRGLAAAPGNGGGLAALEPLLELAMFYEHRERDLAMAQRMAEQALQRAQSRLSLSRGDNKHRAACEQLQQRIARLQAKAARAAERPPRQKAAAAGDAAPAAAKRSRKPRLAMDDQTLFSLPHG